MLRYGKKAATREFFLRALTRLSLNSYILLGLVHSYQGAEEEERRELATALRYYSKCAGKLRRELRSARRRGAEKLTVKSFHQVPSEKSGSGK
jgi:hypothetical protein